MVHSFFITVLFGVDWIYGRITVSCDTVLILFCTYLTELLYVWYVWYGK